MWILNFPTAREPAATIQFAAAGSAARYTDVGGSRKGIPLPRERLKSLQIDPATGARLDDPGTKGGSGFFFPFHWHLLLGEGSVGQWIVAFAAMAMMVSLISGVIIHKDIFRRFFTVQARKLSGRTILDLHGSGAVLALPFHLFITFSGLAIFYFAFFPSAMSFNYPGGERQFFDDARASYSRPPIGKPGPIASLDAMVAEAQRHWDGGMPARLKISYPGDAHAYIEVTRSIDDSVTYDYHPIFFDAGTGKVLKYAGIRPIAKAQRFIAGLHFIFFRHWPLRWLYFILGLTGCGVIATGLLFWLRARTKRLGSTFGVGVVDAMTVGGVTGIMLATGAFLDANRLLPNGLTDRAAWEIRVFFLVWVASFVHACLRRRTAWIEQLGLVALTAFAAVVLNAATTGDTIVSTAAAGNWAVAGVDLMLLTGGALAASAAYRLRRRIAHRPSRRKPARLEHG
jgi:hypothetical protein